MTDCPPNDRAERRDAPGSAADDPTPAAAAVLPSTEPFVSPANLPGPAETVTAWPARWGGAALGPGALLAGRFRISAVKAGGMGRVYLAEDLDALQHGLQLQVAIKAVAPYDHWRTARQGAGQAADEQAYAQLLARFRREAEAWVRLGKHDNIIWAAYVFDVGEQPYLLMEYADGGDLSQRIAAGAVPPSQAVNWALQFCHGMIHAVRTAGLVHRDIKPSNVLLGRGGVLKIADFGLAKAYDFLDTAAPDGPEKSAEPLLSRFGGGTLPYMPPEQFFSLANADTRSDIFAFGAMLFELLTGHRLFPARAAYDQLRLREGPLPAAHTVNPAVPPALSAIVTRCVAFRRADRYQSFVEVRDALEEAAAADPQRLPIPRDTVTLDAEAHAHGITASLINLGQFEKASTLAAQALNRFPHSPELWLNRGVALGHLGRFAESRDCFQRCVALRPGDAQGWAGLSESLLESGDTATAFAAAQRAVDLDADRYDGWFALGRCLDAMNSLPAAEQAYAEAVRLAPHQWKAQYLLGRCRLRQGRQRESLAALEQAVTLDPQADDAWLTYALALAESRRWEDALAAIDRALGLASANPVAHTVRGQLLWDAGRDAAEARRSLEQALHLAPGYEPAVRLLARLAAETAP